MRNYAPISTEDFGRILEEILDGEPGGTLLQIPGVYEVVSEYYNNQILETYDEENDQWEDEETINAEFEEFLMPSIIKQYGKDDVTAMREAYNNWTDSLCKDGRISTWAYENWDNPY